jgi:hypothetical protein
MWVEYLSEIMPGLVILGYLLLWWQAHADLCSLRREWDKKLSELAAADSWTEASILLKKYARDSDA